MLLSKLSCVGAQVRFEAERSREGLQRQLAALDGHAHVMAQRLEDAELETHALEHKVRGAVCAERQRYLLFVVSVGHCLSKVAKSSGKTTRTPRSSQDHGRDMAHNSQSAWIHEAPRGYPLR